MFTVVNAAAPSSGVLERLALACAADALQEVLPQRVGRVAGLRSLSKRVTGLLALGLAASPGRRRCSAPYTSKPFM